MKIGLWTKYGDSRNDPLSSLATVRTTNVSIPTDKRQTATVCRLSVVLLDNPVLDWHTRHRPDHSLQRFHLLTLHRTRSLMQRCLTVRSMTGIGNRWEYSLNCGFKYGPATILLLRGSRLRWLEEPARVYRFSGLYSRPSIIPSTCLTAGHDDWLGFVS